MKKLLGSIIFLVMTLPLQGMNVSQLKTLIGHTEFISAIAWRPDGTMIVTGSSDTTAIIWDVETGKQLGQLTGHTGPITSVAWCRNDRIVTSSFDERIARIWGPPGQVIHQLHHPMSVRAVACLPDGRIVTGGGDGIVRIWDTNGQEEMRLIGHTEPVNDIAVNDDGSLILTGSLDNTARVWDAGTGEELLRLEDDDLWRVAWCQNRIVTGTLAGGIKIWKAANGEEVLSINNNGNSVNAVACSQDGSQFSQELTLVLKYGIQILGKARRSSDTI